LVSKGVRIEVVSRLLGHARIVITAMHCAHLRPEESFDLVLGLLSGNGGNGIGNGAHPAV